jgi:KDO2-lipid IV(A) lauroyltransferase
MSAPQAIANISVLKDVWSLQGSLVFNQSILLACQQLLKFDESAQALTIYDLTNYEAPLSLIHTGAQPLYLSERAKHLVHRYLWSDLFVTVTTKNTTVDVSVRAHAMPLDVSSVGRLIHRFLPYRRGVIVENIKRAYGARISEQQVERLAQSHYTHLFKLFSELVSFRFISLEERAKRVRVEGVPELTEAFSAGKGIIVLTGHFGNFEVSTVSGIEHFPQVKGRIHFLRRPIKPKWLSDFLTRRFNQAGFGVIGRRGSLDEIVTILEKGDAIVFPFDQYARRPEGIEVPFFDVPAGTHKSMAVIAMATGSPVMPAASWREPDGTHVLKFWPPLAPIEYDDVGQEIRLNTAQYNEALAQRVLAHPEQWWWVHRRWKNQRPVK